MSYLDDFQETPIEVPQGQLELIEPGIYHAVLCDFQDFGWPRRVYNDEEKTPCAVVKPVFQLDAINSRGERFLLTDRAYNVLWSPNAGWVEFLTRLKGTKWVADLIASGKHSLRPLVGINCQMQIDVEEKTNARGETKTYNNIVNIMPMSASAPRIEIEGYASMRQMRGYLSPNPSAFSHPETKQVSTPPVFVRRDGSFYTPYGDYNGTIDLKAHEASLGSAPPDDETAPHNAPATDGQMQQLRELARQIHGQGAGEKLRAQFKKHPSEKEADVVLDRWREELRQKQRAPQPVGAGVEADDDDPFGDE